MYLDTKDFQTVWQLAHNWVGVDSTKSDQSELSTDLKETIHRLMAAALNRTISIRTRRMAFFIDDSFWSTILELHHFRRFMKCLRGDVFDKAYLNSIYVKRSDVLRWCQNEFLAPPPVWQPAETNPESVPGNESLEDDEETGWYQSLTEKRRKRVVCLEMAKKLWKIKQTCHMKKFFVIPACFNMETLMFLL